jgi:LPS-assembly protein
MYASCNTGHPSRPTALRTAIWRVLAGSALMTPALLFAQTVPVSASQTPAPATSGIMQDWRTRADMTAEQAGQLDRTCCGMFVEPPLTGDNITLNPDNAPTEIETPTRVSQPEPRQLYVEGDVSVRQGYRSLQASDGLHMNEDTNILSLQGDVVFREPGFLVTGQGAVIDQNTGDNTVESASYVVHGTQIHGSATRLS